MKTSSIFEKGNKGEQKGNMCVFLAQNQQKTGGIKKPESLEISRDSGVELVVRIEPVASLPACLRHKKSI